MRLVFAGTPEIAAIALERLARQYPIALVITRPDAPVGRKKVMTQSPVAEVAQKLGLKVLKAERLMPEHLEIVRDARAGRAVVVAYGALVKKPFLELFPWWNLHFSLLPEWRGATPLQHSMMHQQGIGVTVFELDEGLDTGSILAQQALEFHQGETAGEALLRFTEIGTDLLIETLRSNPKQTPQPSGGTMAPKISRPEARVKFDLPADALALRVNALNPEPAAWAELDGQPIKLLRAKSLGSVNWHAIDQKLEPGRVELFEGRVLCGAGGGTRLELLEVQPAGKKVMSAGDWLRGQAKAVKLD